MYLTLFWGGFANCKKKKKKEYLVFDEMRTTIKICSQISRGNKFFSYIQSCFNIVLTTGHQTQQVDLCKKRVREGNIGKGHTPGPVEISTCGTLC